jgi:plastocyanin
MRRILTAVAVVLLVLALSALAGCSGTSSSTPSTQPAGSASTRPSPTTDGVVSISNFAFNPENVTIQVGQKVTWTNNDSVPHTVTGTDFDSGKLDPGATYSHTFDKAGSFDYKCTIHPSMLAKVTVQ